MKSSGIYPFILSFIFFLCCGFLTAQTNTNHLRIRGTIKDSISQQLIPFAVVTLIQNDSLKQRVISDPDGNFSFNYLEECAITKSKFNLIIEYVCYLTDTLPNLTLTSKDLNLTILLKKDPKPCNIIITPQSHSEYQHTMVQDSAKKNLQHKKRKKSIR